MPVDLEGEDERDVDVDALVNHLLDRGQTLGRRGNLDEHIRAAGSREQVAGFCDGGLGVVGRHRRDLQANVAILLVGAVENRAQDVGGHLDVGDGKRLEDVLAIGDALLHQLRHLLVVVRAPVDRLLEDRGIRGDSYHRVIVNQTLQVAGRDETTPDIVVPDALP